MYEKYKATAVADPVLIAIEASIGLRGPPIEQSKISLKRNGTATSHRANSRRQIAPTPPLATRWRLQ